MFLSLPRTIKRFWYRHRKYPERTISLKDLPVFRFATHIERDDYISKSIQDDGVWEAFETRLFLDQITTGDIVIDVGANIGWYSVLASLRVGPGGGVFSFEPSDENFALLTHNIRRNGLKNINACRAAIGSAETSGELYLSATNRGDHQLNAPDTSRPRETVDVKSLAGVLAGLKSRPAVLKIDTQGSEQRILETVTPSDLANTTIFVEFWPHGLLRSGSSADGLLQILAAFGHRLFVIDHANSSLIGVSVADLQIRAAGDLRPETMHFLDLFCLPPERDLPDGITVQ